MASIERSITSGAAGRILIAGAGPVGLTAALSLARRGIPVTVLEASDRIFDDPRAGTIHPPTLEMFAALGITNTMLARGYVVRNFQYRDRRNGMVADLDLGVLASDTPYPFRLMLEQHKICHMLLALIREIPGSEVLMEHRVIQVGQDESGVVARVATPVGPATFRGAWMIGCDGGRSQVRKSMRVEFSGFTYPERFLVLSTRYPFDEHGYALTNYIADPDEWCALFKVPGHDEGGTWRVVFPVDAESPVDEIFEETAVQKRIQGFHRQPGDYDVFHRNLYDVHQRVASCYRDGRLLLAGDAAHINNPLGGMGMNFGLHDAFNLCEKLALIVLDGADDGLLDRYDRQRRTVAQEYLQRLTIENKRNIEQKDARERQKFYEELRAIATDRVRLRAYLLRAAMIESVRRAQSIS
jgi:3-(3-hydroxy-phenyl)propionate hydroxylase